MKYLNTRFDFINGLSFGFECVEHPYEYIPPDAPVEHFIVVDLVFVRVIFVFGEG